MFRVTNALGYILTRYEKPVGRVLVVVRSVPRRCVQWLLSRSLKSQEMFANYKRLVVEPLIPFVNENRVLLGATR